jgi:hypothetical protein
MPVANQKRDDTPVLPFHKRAFTIGSNRLLGQSEANSIPIKAVTGSQRAALAVKGIVVSRDE